jgi:hypothetical protein
MDLVTSVLTLASARLITFQRAGPGCALLGMSLAFKLNTVLFLPGKIHDSLGLGCRVLDLGHGVNVCGGLIEMFFFPDERFTSPTLST